MSSSQTAGDVAAETVEAVLKKASTGKDRPTDADLGPCYSFLINPSGSAESSSGEKCAHWYCDKSASELHTRVATYLLFLFAFRREGTSKIWVETLENVVSNCEACARGFGIARRTFGRSFLNGYPQANRVTFFSVIDRWQSAFILQHVSPTDTSYNTHDSTGSTLESLPGPMIQLMFAEPSLIDAEELAKLVDATVENGPATPMGKIASAGITPLLIRLLSSTLPERREWALAQLPGTCRRKLTYRLFMDTGVKEEIEDLYMGKRGMSPGDQWSLVEAIIASGGLSEDAIEGGLLSPEGTSARRGIMPVISALLGTSSDAFPSIMNIFARLLSTVPTRSFWAFDPSPDLPHTLLSDIKGNPSFQAMLETTYAEEAGGVVDKGTQKEGQLADPLAWITPFLVSLVSPTSEESPTIVNTGFAEALARVASTCFADWQHARYGPSFRAAAAKSGLDALADLQSRLSRSNEAYEAAMSSALHIHASFIATVTLRLKDQPLSIWADARDAGREVLERFFRSDGRDVLESMLGLSVVITEERKRRQRARRAKAKGQPIPQPTPVAKLHHSFVNKQLWGTAYNLLSPTDVSGVAMIMRSVAPFAHVEKLNRDETWSWKELGLQEVIKEDVFVSGVRAINNCIAIARDSFSQAIESLAVQPDTSLPRSLWDEPGAAKAGIILLLSPADDVHEPIISLIQQSFDDVDDRGDCFRVLLDRYPAAAMDGLCQFLSDFIDTASLTPESCSLAKWLVRCFTDVLEALCQASDAGEPLLQSPRFLSTFVDDLSMSRRVYNLWHLMTTSLAVIFKRTQDWAPLYDNETMVDWMRDALIFGRNLTEHIRAFEAAALGVSSGSSRFVDNGESPAKPTKTGTKLVQKLENVLRDLVSWMRLTDVETLHQTFELVKTILGRVAKTQPDLSTSPELEKTLQEIEKFSRRASNSYRTRLSDDLLSVLSDLLEPFDLDIVEIDEAQYSKSSVPSVPSAPSAPASKPSSSATQRPTSAKTEVAPKPVVRNAFEALMRGSASAQKTAVKPVQPKASGSGDTAKTSAGSSKQAAIEIDDDEDDSFWENFSDRDLEVLEKRAKISTTMPQGRHTQIRRPVMPIVPPSKLSGASAGAGGSKLNINVVPRPQQPPPRVSGSSNFKSQLMRDVQQQVRMEQMERKRNIGGVVPKLPPASGLGSGLGAYQGERRKIKPVESSGSSASESSDEENKGVNALIKKHKSPRKMAHIVPPVQARRPIKILGSNNADLLQQHEDRRARQHAIKMRLRPDVSMLFRHVLAWDPDCKDALAPHHPKFKHELGDLSPLPTKFSDSKRYSQIMLPLFLQELWAQCNKEPFVSLPVTVEVTTRTYEDDFLDVEMTVQGGVPPDFRPNDTDMVVLRSPGAKPILAKVQGFRRLSALKVRILAMMDQPGLAGRSKWQVYRHVTLNTALREFGALQGLPYYEGPLLADILAARSANMPRCTEDEVEDAKKSFNVNEPQAKAILGAMSVKGFALIQGPPGTGKTKTISGLVGSFMSEREGFIPIHGERPAKRKLLVCAPSNAAIDEVCKRLMNGVPNPSGGVYNPNIVRIGMDTSVNIAVKDISLDNLVEARVNNESTGKNGGGGEYSRIQSELEEVKAQIRTKQEEIAAAQGHDERKRSLEAEHMALIQKRTQLGHKSSKAKDAARDATRHLEGARRAAKDAILNEADIICATLSGAGQDTLASYTFETVIIDEAAQAIEMSCLIPLRYGCRRCILVGDPNQLPPTTFSPEAERCSYNQSLFVRLTRQSSTNVQLLSIQYRMHPDISELPSKVFYNGQLKDGPNMAQKTLAIWHERSTFGPYRFLNVEGVETKAGTSTKNLQEAAVAVELYTRLEDDFGSRVDFAYKIGVISMYKQQVGELKRAFINACGQGILERIEFNTVDGFQGQEKDIIILSCVRSGPNLNTIGFLRDTRRMNVALTRAKSSLFVIGNGATLERSDANWRTIVGDARERGFFINYNSKTFSAEAPEITAKKDKKEKVNSTPQPKSKTALANAKPPPSAAESAKPLKRKSSAGLNPDLEEKKRKTDPEAKPTADKPRKSLDTEASSPVIRKEKPQPAKAPSRQSSVSSSSSTRPPPKQPPPPISAPPKLPPGPPSAPPRAPEDVLFHKKKKKEQKPAAGGHPVLPNARAEFNGGYKR